MKSTWNPHLDIGLDHFKVQNMAKIKKQRIDAVER